MKFYRLGLYFLAGLIAIFVKFYLSTNIAKISILTDNLQVSSSTLNFPVNIYSRKDGIYRFAFYIHKDNKKIELPHSYVLALKKGQQYKLDCNLQIDTSTEITTIQPPFVLRTVVQQIYPRQKRYIKSVLVKKPVVEPTVPQVSVDTEPATVTTTETSTKEEPQLVLSEEKIQIGKQQVKKKPDYEININTEAVKKEYKYGESVQINITLSNRSSKGNLKIGIDTSLKTFSGIIVSSTTVQTSLKPQESKEQNIAFSLTDDLLPENYYLELIVDTDGKKQIFTLDTFQLIDLPPKIVISETPVIKYKQTNTLFAEVEDDRGINEVKFVHVNEKKKTEVEYPMILIAGSRKTGLYSFTTEKILQKNYYSFYIKAVDTVGNITKTEVFNVKISR
ncbi:MAG: hypothetical protein N2555_05225 [Endomicrobia bacterium]|nr:hypothetical protein [Endomicrobiia bacterium]